MKSQVSKVIIFILRVFLIYLSLGTCVWLLIVFDTSFDLALPNLIISDNSRFEERVALLILGNSLLILLFLTLRKYRVFWRIGFLSLVLIYISLYKQYQFQVEIHQAHTLELHLATVIMSLLLGINLAYFLYPFAIIKPALKLLPIFSIFWLYITEVSPLLMVITESVLFDQYGLSDPLVEAFFNANSVSLVLFFPLVVFVLSRYQCDIYKYLSSKLFFITSRGKQA